MSNSLGFIGGSGLYELDFLDHKKTPNFSKILSASLKLYRLELIVFLGFDFGCL